MEPLSRSPLEHLGRIGLHHRRGFTFVAIIRYHILFVTRLKNIEIAGITAQPCKKWLKQMARNLTDTFDGFMQALFTFPCQCFTRGERR